MKKIFAYPGQGEDDPSFGRQHRVSTVPGERLTSLRVEAQLWFLCYDWMQLPFRSKISRGGNDEELLSDVVEGGTLSGRSTRTLAQARASSLLRSQRPLDARRNGWYMCKALSVYLVTVCWMIRTFIRT